MELSASRLILSESVVMRVIICHQVWFKMNERSKISMRPVIKHTDTQRHRDAHAYARTCEKAVDHAKTLALK